MQSVVKTLQDGHGTTEIKLLYNGREFVAHTQSNIDLTYPNLGLKVDDSATFLIDEVTKETMAVFKTQAEQIKRLFIRGYHARLTLGFWPTWPKTHTVSAEFSLVGFTKTHQEFLECQKDLQG